jgi:hypothetical protein
MSRSATLYRTVTIVWEDAKSERECDVRVVYEYNGDRDFAVLEQEIVDGDGETPYGLTEDVFNEMVDQAVFLYAAEDYGDWLSGQDDAREY